MLSNEYNCIAIFKDCFSPSVLRLVWSVHVGYDLRLQELGEARSQSMGEFLYLINLNWKRVITLLQCEIFYCEIRRILNDIM